MELDAKLAILGDAARHDLCAQHRQGQRRFTPQPSWAAEEDAEAKRASAPVFRVLMSSQCSWDCAYCPLRASNDLPRTALSPAELADAFLPRYQAGAAMGLFLSSAVDGTSDHAVGQMLDGIEHLRQTHEYRGYVHLKLLPGTSAAAVARAAQLADRISLNLEAPGAQFLRQLAPQRNYAADLGLLREARDQGQGPGGSLKAGLATQFVVGAADERDRDLLRESSWLYRDLSVRRIYFAPFVPASGTPLAEAAATPQRRVRRLQEADWLLRQYGFAEGELPYQASGDLPIGLDPKLAWALAHPEYFPVELNRADRETLLRVPGLGPVAVERIVRLRRIAPLRELEHLKLLGPRAGRAADFVTLAGRFFGRPFAEVVRTATPPAQPEATQLRLF